MGVFKWVRPDFLKKIFIYFESQLYRGIIHLVDLLPRWQQPVHGPRATSHTQASHMDGRAQTPGPSSSTFPCDASTTSSALAHCTVMVTCEIDFWGQE